jgi:hypothetical protein
MKHLLRREVRFHFDRSVVLKGSDAAKACKVNSRYLLNPSIPKLAAQFSLKVRRLVDPGGSTDDLQMTDNWDLKPSKGRSMLHSVTADWNELNRKVFLAACARPHVFEAHSFSHATTDLSRAEVHSG